MHYTDILILCPDIDPLPVSAPAFAAIFGSLLSSLPLQHLGRRGTLLLSGVVFLLGFVLISAASLPSSVPMIIAGRLLCGVGTSLAVPAASVYVAECSEASLRGKLGSLPAVFMAVGCLMGYVVGRRF